MTFKMLSDIDEWEHFSIHVRPNYSNVMDLCDVDEIAIRTEEERFL